jgi:hypothetical protein
MDLKVPGSAESAQCNPPSVVEAEMYWTPPWPGGPDSLSVATQSEADTQESWGVEYENPAIGTDVQL